MPLRKQTLLLPLGIFLTFLPVFGQQHQERKVYALLTVGDPRQAYLEAKRLIETNAGSSAAWHTYLEVLSVLGQEKELLSAWTEYTRLFPEESKNRELLQKMAWGVIEKGAHSTLPIVRVYASVAAYFGQDARGVAVLQSSLRDPNPQIRAVSVGLASRLRDNTLQDEVMRVFETERNPLVKVEAIKAIGMMKIENAKPRLVSILEDGNASAEDKMAAIESLVNLMEKAQRNELQILCRSNRAAHRVLACRIIAHTLDSSCCDLLVPLLQDHSPEVRSLAAQTLGILRLEECDHQPVGVHLEPLLYDPDPYTAISAARSLLLYYPAKGAAALEKWITHSNRDIRTFAAGALASTGANGVPTMRRLLSEHFDPLVSANIALGLIGQRTEIIRGAAALSNFFNTYDGQIMWKKRGYFSYIAESAVAFTPLMPNQPEMVNLVTRIELLSVLAIAEESLAYEVARKFLTKSVWGVSGLSAALLLTEGDEQSPEIIEKLLSDTDPRVQIQAALILAMWGENEESLTTLEAAYQTADKELKEKILDGIGSIGSESSIPFLVQALNEPSQTLRIIAAASLIKCLFH